jgi:Holliday junction resolvasome RuvABC endonuclease subunit
MKVIGIDPSLTGMGWALIDTQDILAIECGTVSSKPTGPAIYARFIRARFMARFISELVFDNIPVDLAVIEAPAYASRTGHAHDRSGLWWQIVAEFHSKGVPLLEVPPTTRAKYGSGKGNASKDTVLASAIRGYPQAPISNNNEADAVILAAIGARMLGEPIEDHPTKVQISALDKLTLDGTEAPLAA